jgi:Cys-tRNA(Pro)/Cys-tRNA(Cys) deacylase
MARQRASAPTPAVAVLQRAGVEHRLHAYDHDPNAASYGDEAVAALGVEAGRVLKTLVCRAGDGTVVAVVPVTSALDLRALATAVGAKRAELAEPADAERLTGYVVGAISPLGQRRHLPAVVDASALGWPTVFCSGGRRGLELELAPEDLLRSTGATAAAIAAPR